MKRISWTTWRYDLAFGLLGLSLVALTVRLVLLTRDYGDKAEHLADLQQRRVFPVPARQGNMFARTFNGYVLLAGSKQVPSCFADPAIIDDNDRDDVAQKTADALGVSKEVLLQELLENRDKRFMWIQRNIPIDRMKAVQALKLQPIGITYEWVREYPNGMLASNVVGFRRGDGEPGAGLEIALDKYFAAEDGRRVVLVAPGVKPIDMIASESRLPQDGKNVYLCLDTVIQGYLQEAVGKAIEQYALPGGDKTKTWAAGVVVEPYTGRVLAMASWPTFDPNKFDSPDMNLARNRAIAMPYEPGSVMKGVFAAAAVDAGTVTYDTKIFCENGLWFPPKGGKISDHGSRYGMLTVAEILLHSSNIGMGKIGLLLGNTRLYEVCQRFGLGEQTGICLPGEDAGIRRDLRKWDTYSTPRVPFGQEIAVTTLQIAMAYSALVNGGLLMRPQLVDHVRDTDGNVIERIKPEVVRRVISQRTSDQTRNALRLVVEDEHGTGYRLKLSRWASMGKTGTAQIPGPGGYIEGGYVGSYVSIAPVERPRVLCIISVYYPDSSKGYYGAKVAGPFVQEVMNKTLAYLNVPGDLPEKPVPAGRTSGTGAGRITRTPGW